jgi:uncharacterized membrane protein
MEVLALVLMLVMFVLVGLNWSGMPQIVPTHYGASGAPDHWGPKRMAWVLPAVGFSIYVLLTTISRLAASGKVPLNVPAGVDAKSPDVRLETARLLTVIKVLVMATFAYIVWRQTSSDPAQGLGALFLPVMLFAPLVVVAWAVLRMRRFSR